MCKYLEIIIDLFKKNKKLNASQYQTNERSRQTCEIAKMDDDDNYFNISRFIFNQVSFNTKTYSS